MKFILASKSPRREEILKKAGINFKIIPSNIDESKIKKNLSPHDYCMRLAQLKADKISKKHTDCTIIGADTIVVINNIILNKPKNYDQSIDMLKKLSGNTHQVLTGVSIQNQSLNINYSLYDTSSVTFYNLSDDEISNYIKKYNPLDKAGSYGIQDGSAIFIKKIVGSYDNIVGFPISKVYQFLKKYL